MTTHIWTYQQFRAHSNAGFLGLGRRKNPKVLAIDSALQEYDAARDDGSEGDRGAEELRIAKKIKSACTEYLDDLKNRNKQTSSREPAVTQLLYQASERAREIARRSVGDQIECSLIELGTRQVPTLDLPGVGGNFLVDAIIVELLDLVCCALMPLLALPKVVKHLPVLNFFI